MVERNNVFWFVTGSQHLYGPETLSQVENQSRVIANELDQCESIPFPVIYKPVVTTSESIHRVMLEANADESCAGVITWMHTFSPAKMWIAGLNALQKPLLHLHTQFNRDIPWDAIDMDFMNLNQSAHGDREYGFLAARMGVARKVVVGHWADEELQRRVGAWTRTAAGYVEGRQLKVARFGDNMREVAVTDGDKVEAQVRFGWSVNGFGVGDLAERIHDVTNGDLDDLLALYTETYEISTDVRNDPQKWGPFASRGGSNWGFGHSSNLVGSGRLRRRSRTCTALSNSQALPSSA
ncbi:hypothetical protein GCM10025859_56670 [Alicyclobacillus fastidiosus]|nr:hypothetical protein GCM10025859_56670 [Alicyclobacillus fastidiosus]